MILTAISFFCVVMVIAVIYKLVPTYENPHEMYKLEDISPQSRFAKSNRLMRMGIFSALAIALHNFPEGLAIFALSLHEPTLGLGESIFYAIAQH
jgi:ZIP family zinc transporter